MFSLVQYPQRYQIFKLNEVSMMFSTLIYIFIHIRVFPCVNKSKFYMQHAFFHVNRYLILQKQGESSCCYVPDNILGVQK